MVWISEFMSRKDVDLIKLSESERHLIRITNACLLVITTCLISR